MKKLILLGLAVLALGSCENETETRYIANEVTVPKGIRIETAEQLAGIGLSEEYPLDGEYYLANDIDLSVLWEEDPDDPPETPYIWRPIGSTCRGMIRDKECRGPLLSTSTGTTGQANTLPLLCDNSDCPLSKSKVGQQPFSGILNGNGKTISGLKLSKGTSVNDKNGYGKAIYLGLFGYVHAAYIHDLTVKVANTAGDRAGYSEDLSNTRNLCIGTLAGLASGSLIENVQIEAEGEGMGLYVKGGGAESNYNYIGGVIGAGLDATLKNVTSSAPLDVIGKDYEAVGGIAGVIGNGASSIVPTGDISGAKVTGNITVTSTGQNTLVAGISPIAGKIENCKVELDELSLTTTCSSGRYAGNSVLAGIGYALTLADCAVDIETIKLEDNDTRTNGRNFYVGGISACKITNQFIATPIPIERCGIRFGKLEVSANASASVNYVYVGGVAGWFMTTTNNISTSSPLSGSSIEGGEIAVSLAKSPTYAPYIGGLVGMGNVSNSSVNGKLKIDVTATGVWTAGLYTGGLAGNGSVSRSVIDELLMSVTTETTGTGQVYVGGLAGNGAISRSGVKAAKIELETATTAIVNAGGLTGYGPAEYSFIGTKDKHAEVKVSKTDTTSTEANLAYIGGVSGYAAPTEALPFRYNYAFCDVSLVTTAATTNANGQSAGGLAGYVSGTSPFIESFAAGSVSITDNFSGSADRKINVGGIAGYGASGITKCAALNGSLLIGGNSSAATTYVYQRRIAYTDATQTTAISSTANNITTVTDVIPAYAGGTTPGASSQDGFLVTTLTEDTFFGTGAGQLGWNKNVWEWDAASGYPVLKQ